MMEVETEKKEQVVSVRGIREEGNLFIAIIVGVLLLVISIIFTTGFGLNTNQIIIFLFLIGGFYIIVLSFLFEPRFIKEIINTITRVEEKQVPKEVIKRVNRPIIYEVEKPIIKEVIKTIDRPVFVKREKLNIPRYEYLGSSQTKTYHKLSCRFGKLVKRKYKLVNNDPQYFIKNGFSPCKVCILKKKKV